MRTIETILLCCAALLLAGCSVFTGKQRQFELGTSAYVTIGRNKPVLHKRGDKVTVGAMEAAYIEAPGYVGVVVLSDGGASSVNKIALRPAEDFLGTSIQKKINRTVNDLVGEINEAQILLSQRKGGEALAKIQRLERMYPDITQVQLLEASCHIVLGDKGRAIAALAEALKLDPKNEPALELYNSLSGIKRAPAAAKSAEAGPKRN